MQTREPPVVKRLGTRQVAFTLAQNVSQGGPVLLKNGASIPLELAVGRPFSMPLNGRSSQGAAEDAAITM